jgi:hypothetical protein
MKVTTQHLPPHPLGDKIERWSLVDENEQSIGVAYDNKRLAERVAEIVSDGEMSLIVAETKAKTELGISIPQE